MAETTTALVRQLAAQNKVEVIADMINQRDKRLASLQEENSQLRAKMERIQHSFMFHSNAIAEVMRATRAAQRTHSASHALF